MCLIYFPYFIAALKRRSSMGLSIRKSRSIVGLTFEDHIAAIPKNASIQDKLLQITSASWSTALRFVQQEFEEDTSIDNPQADLSDHIHKTMKINMSTDTLNRMTSCIQQMCSEVASSGQKPEKIVPPRLKKLHEALDVANNEIKDWKNLHEDRKTMLKEAKLEMKAVSSGDKIVNDNSRKGLPESEEAYLRGLSDGQAELEQIKVLEKSLVLAQKAHSMELSKKRQLLIDSAAETDLMMKKLKTYSEHAILKSD